MTTVSYAQNGEDVVLARAFPEDHTGFYIDVGASDPVVDSVTKRFYDDGWHGINVEPAITALERLRDERQRDTNLGVALGEAAGTATFYELPLEMTGCSTLSPELAEQYRDEGWAVDEREVEITTLSRVCEEHVGEHQIDFLKIDVEGEELAVLAGADLDRFRPRIMVVEATRPGTPTPAYDEWEQTVLGARYELALFDGLNRFYVREEDQALMDVLAVPANYFDDFIPRRYAIWKEETEDAKRQAQDLQRHAQAVQRHAENAQHQAQAAKARADTAEQTASAMENLVQAREIALGQTRQRLAASLASLRDARTELAASREALTAAIEDRRTEVESNLTPTT